MKYLKVFNTRSELEEFENSIYYYPIVVLTKDNTVSNTITYYNKDDININHSVNLNNQWQLSETITNPNYSIFDGVFESYSNIKVNSSIAKLIITIYDTEEFTLYIRSYGENDYDYVSVSQLDTIINNYSEADATNSKVYAHTKGLSTSGATLSAYKEVKFSNITPGTHTIEVVYRKDKSSYAGSDKGYILIPRNQTNYSLTGYIE
jgi:hypothetical protein